MTLSRSTRPFSSTFSTPKNFCLARINVAFAPRSRSWSSSWATAAKEAVHSTPEKIADLVRLYFMIELLSSFGNRSAELSIFTAPLSGPATPAGWFPHRPTSDPRRSSRWSDRRSTCSTAGQAVHQLVPGRAALRQSGVDRTEVDLLERVAP